MDELLKFLGEVLKKPELIPLYIAVGFIFIALALYKFSKELEKNIDVKLDLRFKSVNESFSEQTKEVKEFNKNKYVFDHLVNNFHIYKYFSDNFTGEYISIFEEIRQQILYMKDAFIRNYINGSHPGKAVEVLNVGILKITEALNSHSFEGSTSFYEVVFVYLDIDKKYTEDLIEELARMTNPKIKSTLISKHFNNLYMLSLYMKLQFARLAALSKENILSELEEHWKRFDIRKELESDDEIKLRLSGL